MSIRKHIRKILFENHLNKSDDYKKWKRKNVTLRGIAASPEEYNGVGSITLGDGFYTASLGNKDMARKYGKVYYVVNGKPKHPLIFDNTNKAEIWLQQNLYFKNYKNLRDFNANTTIEAEVQKMGYDGIEIKGREMVNFKPENIQYFKTEPELIHYYENSVKQNIEIVPVDIEFAKKHWNDMFGGGQFTFENALSYANDNLSKSISVNGKIVGVYLLGDMGLPEMLHYYDNDFKKYGLSYKLEKGIDISKYKSKKGIYGILLYVLPDYRNSGIGKKLIEYSESVGDYIWGQHAPKLNNIENWLKRRKLIGKNYNKGKLDGYITSTL